eukprot:1160765-Pelagomonas_calceolata.AAC.1
MMRGARHDGRRKFGVTRDAENGGGALLDHLQFHASRKLVKKQMNKLDAVHQFIQAQALLATSIIFFSPACTNMLGQPSFCPQFYHLFIPVQDTRKCMQPAHEGQQEGGFVLAPVKSLHYCMCITAQRSRCSWSDSTLEDPIRLKTLGGSQTHKALCKARLKRQTRKVKRECQAFVSSYTRTMEVVRKEVAKKNGYSSFRCLATASTF